jgi:hypothetical protein
MYRNEGFPGGGGDHNKIRTTIELIDSHLAEKYNDVKKIDPDLLEDWHDFRSSWLRLYSAGDRERQELKGKVKKIIDRLERLM